MDGWMDDDDGGGDDDGYIDEVMPITSFRKTGGLWLKVSHNQEVRARAFSLHDIILLISFDESLKRYHGPSVPA